MKAKLIGIAAALVIAGIAAYAVSPYFTESTVNEELPDNIARQADVPDGMEPEPMPADYMGTFVGVNDGIHNAEGMASVLSLDDGSQILRLEDFYSTNGPGLYVYLATDKRATDYVSLGSLKANQGNQNYDIPPQTDLERYDHVLIWCEPFSVLFGSAQIMRGT